MPNTYLPATDSGLLNWVTNFSTIINLNPPTYGLEVEEAAAYGALRDDYAAKYTAAVDPATRGGATVLAKNQSKKVIITESRKLAMFVTTQPTVTDEQRYDLGLTVKDTDPTPVPVPDTSPTIDVLAVEGWTVNFRLHNGDSTKRAKPEGVRGATMFSYVGEQPPSSIDDWKFEGSITKTDTKIVFPTTLAAGTKIWLTAFWFNPTSQSGPAAVPVSTQINYGGLSQAA